MVMSSDRRRAASRAVAADHGNEPGRPALRLIGFDALLTLATGAAAMLIFGWRSRFFEADPETPLAYKADAIQYGNVVWNAILGNPFTSGSLGAPGGQQFGLSSYGVEWIPSLVAAAMSPAGATTPWPAIYRYILLTYVLTGATAYLALRWVRAPRVAAVMGALGFCLIPQHQENAIAALFLANLFAVPLALALALRILEGARFEDLPPSAWRWRRRLSGWCIASVCIALLPLGANYYMVFALMTFGLSAIVAVTRRQWWPRAIRLGGLTGACVLASLVAYGPILFARARAGVGPEDSQSDRRPFAAYLNGGDPLSLFSPFRNGFVEDALKEMPRYAGFATEYDTSTAVTIGEYSGFRGGTALLAVFAVLALAALGAFSRADFLRRRTPLPPLALWAVVILVLLALAYSRGGLGTLISFLLPQIRGYARLAAFVAFTAIALLALLTSSRATPNRALRVTCSVLLAAVALESVTAVTAVNQPRYGSSIVEPVVLAEFNAGVETPGLVVRTLGPEGAERLAAEADRLLPDDCVVLVLPLAKYPVDFGLGLTSYYAYELLKPGLVASDVYWSSGGFAGTPHNRFTDTWLAAYQRGEVDAVVDAAEAAGYCGILLFSGLQDAFHGAGPVNGSAFAQSGSAVAGILDQRYGRCYDDSESAVHLYCTPTA